MQRCFWITNFDNKRRLCNLPQTNVTTWDLIASIDEQSLMKEIKEKVFDELIR